jgi:hypothetical protein
MASQSIEVNPVIKPIAYTYAIDLTKSRADAHWHIRKALEERDRGIDLFESDYDDCILYVEVSNTLFGSEERYDNQEMAKLIGNIVNETLTSLI